jgi:hypothetical protein
MKRLGPLFLIVVFLAGCLSSAGRQSVTTRPPATQPSGQDTGAAPPSQIAQQSGQGNVTGQLDARGWTGLEYTTAVPVGQVVLLALMLVLSHRREMARIKQSG